MKSALAIRYEDLDNKIDEITVECPNCDPDSPASVHPKMCSMCKGTRRAPIALSVIAKELHQSRTETGTEGCYSDGDEDNFV
jgi:hypothetical protein